MEKPKPFSLSIRVLLFVGDDANTHNLLQEGRPFIMRFQQLSIAHRSAGPKGETTAGYFSLLRLHRNDLRRST